mmetsp:Transcript_46360/g.100816  ORF Transcript_46360/g.100816 Transcript_46360/m.100816 type:complete len:200 (+) Transcript_46360:142-741(+)
MQLEDTLGRELGCCCEAAVVGGPGFHHGYHRSHVHQGRKFPLLGDAVQLCLDSGHDLGIPAHLRGLLAFDSGLLRQFYELLLLDLSKGHGTVQGVVRVAADATGLCVDEIRVVVGDIHQLNGDVFATLQLDQVLLAIHYLELALRGEHSDIASVEPAILVEILTSLLCHLVVARRDRSTPQPDLSSACALRAVRVSGVC